MTYESFAGAWPTYEGPFADKMNSMPKVVVSSTLTDPEWNNTTVLSGDVVAGVRELKAADGGPIQVPGSCTLVHTLLDNDLVDELRLMVFPVSIGGGLRVFPETRQRAAWRLDDTRTFASGRAGRHLPPGLTVGSAGDLPGDRHPNGVVRRPIAPACIDPMGPGHPARR